MTVRHSQQIEAEVVQAGTGISKQVLISAEEGPHFAMRRFVIEPDGSMPVHTNLVEHEQYVLGGHAEIGIGDDVYEVQEGDVVFIRAEVPHSYKNIGSEDFEFLCMVPNTPDKTTILE